MILKIRKSKDRTATVKVYARVASRSREGVAHLVGYIRSKSTRRWFCGCDDFLYNQIGKNRNCAHIKEVREAYGRYGQRA